MGKTKEQTESSSLPTRQNPFAVPERGTEKELRVLIELNQTIIGHWKKWANAEGPDAYAIACREMKEIRRLVGADQQETEDVQT